MQLSLRQTACLGTEMRTPLERAPDAGLGAAETGNYSSEQSITCTVNGVFLSKCRIKWKMLWEPSGI